MCALRRSARTCPQAICAACIYLACRQSNTPRLFKEITAVMPASVRSLRPSRASPSLPFPSLPFPPVPHSPSAAVATNAGCR